MKTKLIKILFSVIILFAIPTFTFAISAQWNASTTDVNGDPMIMSGYNCYDITSTRTKVNSSLIPISICVSGVCTWPYPTLPTSPTTIVVRAVGPDGILESVDSNSAIYYPVPIVTTNAATAITSTAATLNGSVNPNGIVATAYFQWGTSTSYGSTTTTQSIPAGTTNVAITANLTGLTASTTYHYRIVAINATGTTNGADISFTTLAPAIPSAPSGLMWK